MKSIDFDELLGGEFDFSGVDGQCFCLDDVTYQVMDIDGEDDYYVTIAAQSIEGLPLARIVVEESSPDNVTGYQLTDLHDGHCWLCFGLEYHDTSERSFDAEFVFDYTPKGPDGEAII